MTYTWDQSWELQAMLLDCDKDCGRCGHPLADHDAPRENNPGSLWCRVVGCEHCHIERAS